MQGGKFPFSYQMYCFQHCHCRHHSTAWGKNLFFKAKTSEINLNSRNVAFFKVSFTSIFFPNFSSLIFTIFFLPLNSSLFFNLNSFASLTSYLPTLPFSFKGTPNHRPISHTDPVSFPRVKKDPKELVLENMHLCF